MKNLVLALTLFVGLCLVSPTISFAQEVIISSSDSKTQEKVEKSKVQLQKYTEEHQKVTEKRQSLQADFEKKRSAGKLSPNDIDKITKKINKRTKSIEKLEKKMAKLDRYIREHS
ncbi:hypothetical protein LZF95_25490 [Algoriphagus sp. AGSA1]|uniref:hypothetical protein n=1 Tax=Algoriphagus sp. AGSA1 TaxID=2907213 RepID=UPI001F240A11|nr:hypothetical protein [Algoriphagus sp. AGSA1]MCE7058061.1 hypothetical protein [Algoriphagus sp. AGSA1]